MLGAWAVFVVIIITASLVISFKNIGLKPSRYAALSKHALFSTKRIEVCKSNEILNGDRKIISTPAGSVIVANVGHKFYAVNAKCPHLGMPMKRGTIDDNSGIPTITCTFHNSQFSLEDGSCKVWCSKVFGIPGTEFIAGAMSKLGGKEFSSATTYKVIEEGGKLFVEI